MISQHRRNYHEVMKRWLSAQCFERGWFLSFEQRASVTDCKIFIDEISFPVVIIESFEGNDVVVFRIPSYQVSKETFSKGDLLTMSNWLFSQIEEATRDRDCKNIKKTRKTSSDQPGKRL